jgi:hypothetical protein
MLFAKTYKRNDVSVNFDKLLEFFPLHFKTETFYFPHSLYCNFIIRFFGELANHLCIDGEKLGFDNLELVLVFNVIKTLEPVSIYIFSIKRI